MRFTILTFLLFFVGIAFFSGSAGFARKKPEAELMGTRKGNIDKLTFIAAKEIALTNNEDSLWKVSSYEFNFSCDGKMTLKQYSGAQIDKEIIMLVKNCDKTTIADFRYIKAKNTKTGKEVRLNDIQLTIKN